MRLSIRELLEQGVPAIIHIAGTVRPFSSPYAEIPVLTMDRTSVTDYSGIRPLNVLDFPLEDYQ
jgi:hypothetical protein